MNIPQACERLIQSDPAYHNFQYGKGLSNLSVSRAKPDEAAEQLLQTLAHRPNTPPPAEINDLLTAPAIHESLHYLARRLNVSYSDSPHAILASLASALPDQSLTGLWDFLRRAATLSPSAHPLSYQEHPSAVVSACTTIRQLLLPHHADSLAPIDAQFAEALEIPIDQARELLDARPTSTTLLRLHHAACDKLLDRIAADWPPPWLDYGKPEPADIPQGQVGFLRQMLCHQVADYACALVGNDAFREYLDQFTLPEHYLDILVDEDDDDPFNSLDPLQLVEHAVVPDEEYELFAFEDPRTARLFEWLVSDRQHFSHYVWAESNFYADPYRAELAYSLRDAILESYYAPLPADSFPNYLALVRALANVTVPPEWYDGALPELSIRHIGSLHGTRFGLTLGNDHAVDSPTLAFAKPIVHLYLVVDSDNDGPPAAIILTTADEPGDPAKYRQQKPLPLPGSDGADFVYLANRAAIIEDMDELMDELYDAVVDNYFPDGHFLNDGCAYVLSTVYPNDTGSGPFTLYAKDHGYMLQLNQNYTFAPNQMAQSS